MSLALSRGRLAATAFVSLALAGAGLAVGVTGAPTASRPLTTAQLQALLRGAAQLPTTGRFGVIGSGGGESAELRSQLEQWADARTAPGIVSPGAYSAAFAALSGLPASGTATELTTVPYNSDDLRYRDPAASNSTGGAGVVAGRITGLAVDVGHGKIYAAGADGGVWRGSITSPGVPNGWVPISDGLPTLSTGDLKYDAGSNTLWLATGEGNTGAGSWVGSGVYRLSNPSADSFSAGDRVGDTELESTMINKIQFDGHGTVWAATSRGLWSHPVSGGGSWTMRFAPNPSFLPGGANAGSGIAAYMNIANDVAVQPDGTATHLVASLAWRAGAAYNGFYRSDDGGTTWRKTNPGGAINPKEIGNAEFAYAADGSKLYTVLESTFLYNKPTGNTSTVLAGVYVSNNGSVDGPWNLMADSKKLANSGSALKQVLASKGYGPGVQDWYNNFIAVDPADANHVWVGLEEVFETANGGSTWSTPGPYWNLGFACWSFDPARNTCPHTVHPDQHSIALGGGRVYVGDDGGVYSRPVRGHLNANGNATDWADLNSGLRTLQFYSVATGSIAGHGLVLTGGLQDNGQLLQLGDDTVAGSPFGGDGGDTLVDPRPGHGCNIVAEYVFLAMSVTNNCGVSDGTTHAIRAIGPADPSPRFIAPFADDSSNPDHWIAGGRYVWTQDQGYAIPDASAWTNRFDTGAGHSITAVAMQDGVGYVTWCGPCNPSGFTRGIATNAGGSWHAVSTTGVPNRYLGGVTIDPADASGMTAYVAVNGFSRQWTEGPGAGVGHLYKTTDGGATWSLAGATLPDIPASSFVVDGGTWYLATDLGVVTSTDAGATWHRVTGFPYVTVTQLRLGPDGSVYASTHGRGLWRVSA